MRKKCKKYNRIGNFNSFVGDFSTGYHSLFMSGKKDAIQIFNAAVRAVQPVTLIASVLSLTDRSLHICGETILIDSISNIYVIGAGKAAAAMAMETEKILGNRISKGIVVTKYGHSLDLKFIKIIEAAHPIPDENCVRAVSSTLRLLEKVTKNDIIICLLSGGASSLWCDLPSGIRLEDLQTTFNLMITSGASIAEVNCIRKHLSSIKGGQLLSYCNGARVFSMIISDVPTDDLSVIASGPTVGDLSTFNDAYYLLNKYKLLRLLPEPMLMHIKKGMKGIISETPKPDDPLFKNTVNKIIGSNKIAIIAAKEKAQALGYDTFINPKIINGNTVSEAKQLVIRALAYNGKKPLCIIQIGETTIKVTGRGKGGRNQHFVLTALNQLIKINENPHHEITILSAGTDGTDGPTNAAGGIINNKTIKKVLEGRLPIKKHLENHSSYNFLKRTNSLFITGPTQTNVMDIMIAIIK